jgi:hypothetical protein
VLGIMPLSHVQGIVASHGSIYIRDRFILHSKFDMKEAMASIQAHRVNRLYLVHDFPPTLLTVIDLALTDSGLLGTIRACRSHWQPISV